MRRNENGPREGDAQSDSFGSSLIGSWVHSHEEDRGDLQVFRPDTFEFPPSRGRTSFTLRPDGSASTGQPGPDDRGSAAEGSWQLAGTVLSLHVPDWNATFHVLTADSGRLELRPV